MNTSCPFFIVDAFSREPFAGNPAGVCLLRDELPPELMQRIAAEINLSETAFVLAGRQGFSIRWFTPLQEMPLCGHATLASAAALREAGWVEGHRVDFESASGSLVAVFRGDEVALDFPADQAEPAEAPGALVSALGNPHVEACFRGKKTRKLVFLLDSEQAVRELRPDFGALRGAVPVGYCQGVAVTAAGSGGFNLVSRYFHPWAGVDEDPVTGSVHTLLGPWWGARLGLGSLRAWQASRRGGELGLRLTDEGRILIQGGYHVTVRGSLGL